MELNELNKAKQILLEHRPDRPHSTKNRQLQAAIDAVIPVIDGRIAEIEMTEKMLNAMDEEDRRKHNV